MTDGMLTPGLRREEETVTAPADSAASGLALVPDVYASARMIFFIESVCARLMAEHLEPGQMSVGVAFELTHDAPTPIGMKVRASVEVVEASGRKVVFAVEARDEVEVIGRGKHGRAIIDAARFDRRVAEKAAARRP
jgi:fluoroacetyl-CoA thioesterase